MGLPSGDFWNLSMFEYQILRDSHFLKSGLTEDGENPDTMTADDLDNLYASVGDK